MAYVNAVWEHEKGLWPLEEGLKVIGLTLNDLEEWIPGHHAIHMYKGFPDPADKEIGGMAVQVKVENELKVAWAKYSATPDEIAEAVKAVRA